MKEFFDFIEVICMFPEVFLSLFLFLKAPEVRKLNIQINVLSERDSQECTTKNAILTGEELKENAESRSDFLIAFILQAGCA